jgi:ubiquinone/menaquinone biosynthesis C-methylase UbiE
MFWVAIAAAADTYEGRPIAPVMSAAGAPWLERDDRAAQEGTRKLLAALPVERGDTVVDLGCGTGFHARLLARAVGPTGTVYCVDLQQEMLDRAMALARAEGLTLVPVLGSVREVPVPAGVADLVLLVDVFHELSDPAAMLASIRASLAPDGVAAVVEFRLEGESAAFVRREHRMAAAQVVREWTGAGFALAGRVDSLPVQHLLWFTSTGSTSAE